MALEPYMMSVPVAKRLLKHRLAAALLPAADEATEARGAEEPWRGLRALTRRGLES